MAVFLTRAWANRTQRMWFLGARSGLILGLGFVVVACSPSGRKATATSTSAVGGKEALAPDFAGTAAPDPSGAACRRLVPVRTRHPFTPADHSLTVRDYSVIACWTGTLDSNRFTLGVYFAPAGGGGIAIHYGDKLVAHLQVGSGPPVVVRFTDDTVCFAENAGAYFSAVSIRTGVRMDEERAQDVCAPPTWPPEYVLGLGDKHFPVTWPNQR